MTVHDRVLVWFRRDLRHFDHAALSHALQAARAVHCVFVFDTEILDALEDREDRRVEFLWHTVTELKAELERLGGGLHVLHGRARDLVPQLAARLGVEAVYANHDYEPAAIERDAHVAHALAAQGRGFKSFKDQVVFERAEVLTKTGKPYHVFTPYKNAWLAALSDAAIRPWPVADHASTLVPDAGTPVPALDVLGFRPTNLTDLKLPLGIAGGRRLVEEFLQRIDHYHERRDYPAVRGPSYLSVHLRFGTVSVRELVRHARASGTAGAHVWLSELIWREFYFQLLWHYPHVVNHSFKPEFEALRFENREDWFAAWCEGRTGYPIVDAAMRQLNTSGYMHNRLRMIAASFLVKDLLVDWRWGERYFARKLNDFDLAANNGGWQWAASTGCDAQPYFRIFSPVSQSERFDESGRFLRQYLPVLSEVPARFIHAPWTMGPLDQQAAGVIIGRDYPAPIVDHAQARQAALRMFAAAKPKPSPEE